MNFLKDLQTNWKYILIIAILIAVAVSAILIYQYWWVPREEARLAELEALKKDIEDETTNWKTYRNEEYGIEIRYPISQIYTPGFEQRLFSVSAAGNIDNYRCQLGPNEFIEGTKSEIENTTKLKIENCEHIQPSLDEWANGEAYHRIKPYGDNPVIKSLEIEGQDARSVTSEDPQYTGAAIAIVSPRAIIVNSTPWAFVIIYTSKDFVDTVVGNIKFLSK